MTAFTATLIFFAGALFPQPRLLGDDLARYRGFELGMSLPGALKHADLPASEVKEVHRRPALIQDLEWSPKRRFGSSRREDPVRNVRFSFYNGELFRMAVRYDQDRTEGLTADDLVEAISKTYGEAVRPADATIHYPSIYNQSLKVIARWDDALHSLNLVDASHPPGFGLVLFLKRLNSSAVAAIAEAVLLDEREAPERENERLRKQDSERRDRQERARLVNKPGFRP